MGGWVGIHLLYTTDDHSIVEKDNPVFRFATCGGQQFQFQINNTLYPNWTSTKAVDWWQHTKLAVGDQGNMLFGSFPILMNHYTNNFFLYACSLEHQTDGDERFIWPLNYEDLTCGNRCNTQFVFVGRLGINHGRTLK